MKQTALAILAFAVVVACGRPGPSTRSFERADILGTWTRSDSHPVTQGASGAYSVSVTLREDGTFHQTIEAAEDAGTHQTSGTWTLEASRINLKGLLTDDWDQATDRAKWTKRDAHWWFVDWHGGNGKVALFGGLHPDPDSFAPWTRKN